MADLEGVLFFPVTPFDASGSLNLDVLTEHLEKGLAARPGGVFVACGTGEFHALDPQEYKLVVRRTADVVSGAVPVYAGAGGPLPLAKYQATTSFDAGVDGLLLLPPYLVNAPPTGLVNYVRQVASASGLPLIVYNRDNAVFDPWSAVEVARIPTVSGFKDGRGDLEMMGRIVAAVRDSLAGTGKAFQFFNGLPTAEVTVLAYRAIGVDLYSSAAFAFIPEVSLAFYTAVRDGDAEQAERLLAGFFRPLVTLRNKVPGYAVSLVKAGVRLSGLDAGGVRAPLIDPTSEHEAELSRIISDGRALVTAH